MSKSNMFSDEELTNAQKDKHKKANTTIEQGGEINPITADMGIMGTKAEQKYIWFNLTYAKRHEIPMRFSSPYYNPCKT